MHNMITSTCSTNDEAISKIHSLHCPQGFDVDLTYGNGCFYKKNGLEPRLKLDISPQVKGVFRSCSSATGIAERSIQSVVFDPPFLTYVTGGRGHKSGGVVMSSRFGGYYRYEELFDHYTATIRECRRILKKSGVLVFKCQDIIHNHRMHCTHHMVITECEKEGFRLLDLFVLVAKSRMPGPQKGTQRHARVFHSYFLVFKLL